MLGLGCSAVAAGFSAEGVERESVVKSPAAADATLVKAVRERQVLKLVYNGHARVVEPHAYGVAATGEVVLHAFQIEGGSTSKPPPGWRTFSVALIEKLEVTEARFSQARPGYVPGEPVMEMVWAALEPAP